MYGEPGDDEKHIVDVEMIIISAGVFRALVPDQVDQQVSDGPASS